MNPVCGDTLALTLRIEDERIAEARFQTEGCTASVATSSILTEMVTGLTLDEALALTPRGRLGGGRRPAGEQAAQRRARHRALRRAIASYSKQGLRPDALSSGSDFTASQPATW